MHFCQVQPKCCKDIQIDRFGTLKLIISHNVDFNEEA
jgi:hypothetical protein